MTDRPIIFSAPMIRALLDGRKSQTRRILKPQPVDGLVTNRYGYSFPVEEARPYAVGDRLWVRENWRPCSWDEDSTVWVEYAADKVRSGPLWGHEDFLEKICDEMDRRGAKIGEDGLYDSAVQPRGRPSIHMPRWASRLTLLVTGVKVERLQEISEEDAKAEGIRRIGDQYPGSAAFKDGPNFYGVDLRHGTFSQPTARECFAGLWSSINGEGAWEANPWIVAVTFTVHKGNIGQLTKEAA